MHSLHCTTRRQALVDKVLGVLNWVTGGLFSTLSYELPSLRDVVWFIPNLLVYLLTGIFNVVCWVIPGVKGESSNLSMFERVIWLGPT